MAVAYRTVKDLKLHTPAVLRATRRQDVVITLHGKPVAILRRFTPAELEATVLLQSKGLRAQLRKALESSSRSSSYGRSNASNRSWHKAWS